MSIEFNIKLYCKCCGQKLKTSQFYEYGNDPTVLNVDPCKKGCSEEDMIQAMEEYRKERIRKENLPRVPVFGDHLRATR